MAGLCVPLSTLRPRPCGRRRMTRGQDGSLFLSCAALASATPCRILSRRLPRPLLLFPELRETFSPDGKILAVANYRRGTPPKGGNVEAVSLFEVATGKMLIR